MNETGKKLYIFFIVLIEILSFGEVLDSFKIERVVLMTLFFATMLGWFLYFGNIKVIESSPTTGSIP